VAVKTAEGLKVVKRSGKLSVLEAALKEEGLEGHLGIGHTRWATHGAPTDPNAHPHTTEDGRIAVIHNGIIENYLELKEALKARGHRFSSDTDSEVLAHLIEEKYRGDLLEALREALKEVRGAYAVVAVHQDHEEIVAARTVSPLVVGLGEGENFLASDVPALLPYTRKVIFLHDGDVARITREGVEITDLLGNPLLREAVEVDWSLEAAEKGGFPHYMLKEIYEQPWVLENTLGGRLLEEVGDVDLGPAGGQAQGWGSSTPRALASPGRWRRFSTSTPGRRSAWLLPRPTWPCWRPWPRARSGKVIAVATEGDEEIRKLAQDVVYVPQVHPLLSPMVSVVPLQLLAYETALLLGRDVDQPRNLAKSVTVE
jgi:glucosamine 6-phosphate synthetase-like amidotransferase/phosphosugar isomerase protein